MYIVSRNNQTLTYSDNDLITIAKMYADDETDGELIINELSALKYLEYKGFEVKPKRNV